MTALAPSLPVAYEPALFPVRFRNVNPVVGPQRIAFMVEKCRIQSGCLEDTLRHTATVCEASSLTAIREFCRNREILRTYAAIEAHRIPQRAVRVATEILGPDTGLTAEQLRHKAKYHLWMAVQMTAQWLLDDVIDVEPALDTEVSRRIIDFYLAVLESDVDHSEQERDVQAHCLRSGIYEHFVGALRMLAEWQRRLAIAIDIALTPSALFPVLNREFLQSFHRNHDVFTDWNRYVRYRTANSGLGLGILAGAYWFCYLAGVDPKEMERQGERYRALIYRYSLLGAVSNDLFGYDKDLGESVATSVEVLKRSLPHTHSNEEDLTASAFHQAVALHNRRLDALAVQLNSADNPVETAVLSSALTTTWSIRVLHHDFRAIYQPITLQRILTSTLRSNISTI